MLEVEVFRVQNGATHKEAFLRESDWSWHVRKHPDLLGKEAAVKQTVEDPQIAVDYQSAVYKYRLGHGSGKTARLYLQVIERPELGDTHRVRTAWFTRELIQSGRMLRLRPGGG